MNTLLMEFYQGDIAMLVKITDDIEKEIIRIAISNPRKL